MNSILSVKIYWMDFFCEFSDARQRLEIWTLYLVLILMYMDGIEQSVNEVWHSFWLVKLKTTFG